MDTRSTVAVVIAAGAGTRLRETSRDDDVVKPVTPLLGVPLVVRTLRTLYEAGVARAVVVTGYRAEELTSLLPGHPWLRDLELGFVHNQEWRKRNGISVLAAAEAVGDRVFFLSMADHVYGTELVAALQASPPAPGDLHLAVDYRVHEVSDPDDATWVKVDVAGRIRDIGKDIEKYDAVDTGLFLSTPALFGALGAEARERDGDCALSDGVRRLGREGRARAVDVGDAWWQDVDTQENLQQAELKLGAARASGGDRQRLADGR